MLQHYNISHKKTALPLIQLYDPQPTPDQTADVFYNNKTNFEILATYAQGVGVNKVYFADESYSKIKQIVSTMQNDYNLKVHPWTIRADREINAKFNNNFFVEEMYYYCCLGVDAVFSEYPDRSRETIDTMRNYTAATASSVKHQACVIDCTLYN